MRLFRCLVVIAASLAVANPITLSSPPTAPTVGKDGGVKEEKKRRLLVIGQSKGYQHDSISTAMVTLYNLGRSSKHWDTFFRTECAAITKKPLKWGAKNLDAFDAGAFFTDGDLDMDDSQKADLLSFVRDDGKGFIGIHSAAITFTSWPEYGKMLGGYFDGHPWGEFQAPLVVEDPNFPGMTRLSQNFTLHDEIYQIKDFAGIWAREYGKGRVLYNGLGHREEVWGRPDIQKMWVDMVRWSMGDLPGDAAPRPASER